MKIAFFLTPKAEVGWLADTSTARQAIERMEHHGYTALPMLRRDGTYAGTLTEGDLLWFLKNHPQIRFEDTSRVPVVEVTLRRSIRAVHVDAEIEDLIALALDQSFVPVVDDRDVFIGIVRRRTLLTHFRQRMVAELREELEGLPP